MAITRRQREVYDFLQNFVDSHGYSPSFEEICQGLGLSSLATVHKHLTNLEQKGLIKRDYNRSRSIDVIKTRSRSKAPAPAVTPDLSLPLLGVIAAGRPLEAVENAESISLNDFAKSSNVYVLRVRGESMQDEHIVDGDYVLVEKTNTARNGEIVVALVGKSEATLKRIYLEGEQVRLQPSNAAMRPILAPASEVEVQGRVIGVLRKY
jgi:repressor LexA